MSLLTRDAILTANDLPTEDVPVPEWGGEVRVRTMTGAERDAYETRVAGGGEGKRNLANIRAGLVALTLVDDQGETLFKKDDVERLGMKSAKALDRVADVAMRLAGLSDEDAKKLAAEEAVEDFDGTPTPPSTSD